MTRPTTMFHVEHRITRAPCSSMTVFPRPRSLCSARWPRTLRGDGRPPAAPIDTPSPADVSHASAPRDRRRRQLLEPPRRTLTRAAPRPCQPAKTVGRAVRPRPHRVAWCVRKPSVIGRWAARRPTRRRTQPPLAQQDRRRDSALASCGHPAESTVTIARAKQAVPSAARRARTRDDRRARRQPASNRRDAGVGARPTRTSGEVAPGQRPGGISLGRPPGRLASRRRHPHRARRPRACPPCASAAPSRQRRSRRARAHP